jgi:hypothetical protein
VTEEPGRLERGREEDKDDNDDVTVTAVALEDTALSVKDARQLTDEFTYNSAKLVAAMIADSMSRMPRLLDFVAKADKRLFRPEEVDTMPKSQLAQKRNLALRDVRDLMTFVRQFTETAEEYLVGDEKRDRMRRITRKLAKVDDDTIRTLLAKLDSLTGE